MAGATLEQLMEAGVHFGHQTHRWNPKMKPYLWGKRNGIHIIDLTKTVVLLEQAYQFLRDSSAAGKRVVFVGTKKQAAPIVEAEALRSGSGYVNKRWLGGMLTNSAVINTRVKKYRELESLRDSGHFERLGKKEVAALNRQLVKMERMLGGLKDLRGSADILVIVDQKREHNAVQEAIKAGVQTICLLDSNADPTLCNYNIPGNDDALKSIQLIVGLMADAILEGRAEREKAHAQRKDDTSAPNAMTTAMAAAEANADDAETPMPALVGAGKADEALDVE